MATNGYPTIGSELVELVETMRAAQIKYFDMIMEREGRKSDHERRRALQAAKAAERKVDEWIANYHAELQAYQRAMKKQQTDEEPGLYDATKTE